MNFTCQRGELTIRGIIYGAEGGEPKPVVILSHPFLANRRFCDPYAKFIASLGFVAVTYDFCGGGRGVKSDGKTSDMTVFTELEDLFAVLDYIRQQPFADPGRISLMGCSQGGFVSAMAAMQIPAEIRSLLLFYPALCIPDDARSGRMMFYRFDPKNIPPLLGRFPMKLGGEYARVVIDRDYRDMIGGYEGPVLFLHGTKDEIVNISYAREAQQKYPSCEYHEIVGGKHGFKRKYEKEARGYLAAFLQKVCRKDGCAE